MIKLYDFIKKEFKDKNLPYYIEKITNRIEEKFLLDKMPRILIITMPPRSTKTTIASKYFPQWIDEQFSDKSISLFSYSENIVNIHIKNLSGTIKNKIYNANSCMNCGVKTDILIIDDYFMSDEDIKNSDKIYKKLSDYIYYNLNTNPFILIMASRWSKNDVVGTILEHIENGYVHKYINNFLIDYINIPALSLFNKKQNDSFWIEKYSKERLLQTKKLIGERWWESLYQGMPQY